MLVYLRDRSAQTTVSVSEGQVSSDNCTYCHTEIEVADQTFDFKQLQHTDTGPTSPTEIEVADQTI